MKQQTRLSPGDLQPCLDTNSAHRLQGTATHIGQQCRYFAVMGNLLLSGSFDTWRQRLRADPLPTLGCSVAVPTQFLHRCGTAVSRCRRCPCQTAWLAARSRKADRSKCLPLPGAFLYCTQKMRMLGSRSSPCTHNPRSYSFTGTNPACALQWTQSHVCSKPMQPPTSTLRFSCCTKVPTACKLHIAVYK